LSNESGSKTGIKEVHPMHQMWCDRFEYCPFPGGLADQQEMPILEVPHTTVKDLRGAGGRAEGEVLLVD
jgi:hypothetical protein